MSLQFDYCVQQTLQTKCSRFDIMYSALVGVGKKISLITNILLFILFIYNAVIVVIIIIV